MSGGKRPASVATGRLAYSGCLGTTLLARRSPLGMLRYAGAAALRSQHCHRAPPRSPPREKERKKRSDGQRPAFSSAPHGRHRAPPGLAPHHCLAELALRGRRHDAPVHVRELLHAVADAEHGDSPALDELPHLGVDVGRRRVVHRRGPAREDDAVELHLKTKQQQQEKEKEKEGGKRGAGNRGDECTWPCAYRKARARFMSVMLGAGHLPNAARACSPPCSCARDRQIPLREAQDLLGRSIARSTP